MSGRKEGHDSVNAQLALALGVVAWSVVFIFLLASLAIAADVERRWDESWVLDWEQRTGLSVDVLIDRLGGQVSRWRLGRRLLTIYLLAGIAALVLLAALQFNRWAMTATTFRDVMLFVLAIVGLILLPLRVSAEIGLGLVEGMYRQVRRAVGERIVIESRAELTEIPRPPKPKGKGKVAAGTEQEQAAK